MYGLSNYSAIGKSEGSGRAAISSSVSSLSIVSPVRASWNVPIGRVMVYAFRYPYTVIVPPVTVPAPVVKVKPVAEVVLLM